MTPSARGRGHVGPLLDLLLDLPHKPLPYLIIVPRRAEGVVELLVAQAREQAAGPGDVVGRDVGEQVLVAAVVVEDDVTALDLLDEAVLLEPCDVVAAAEGPAGLPERGAEVLHDVPPLDAAALFSLERVHAVLARREVPVVQQDVHDDEAAQLTRADERIVGPGPLPLALVVALQAKTAGLGRFGVAAG